MDINGYICEFTLNEIDNLDIYEQGYNRLNLDWNLIKNKELFNTNLPLFYYNPIFKYKKINIIKHLPNIYVDTVLKGYKKNMNHFYKFIKSTL